MIFVSNNCDALCACKILTDLLKQHNIQYTCVPVFGYGDIESNLTEESMSSDIRSLVFLNCGAKLDFTAYWFNQRETEIKTFVFDSQRPIIHNNVLTQKAVYVIDDGDIDVDQCPEDEDLEAFEADIEAEAEEDIVDGEKEYQLIINGGKKPESEKDDDEDSENKENINENAADDEENDDFDPDLIGKKRKRVEVEEELDLKRKRKMRVTNYYSGEYFSK